MVTPRSRLLGSSPYAVGMRRRWAAPLLGLNAVVGAFGLLSVGTLRAEAPAVVVVAPPFQLAGSGDARAIVPVHSFTAGSAIPGGLEVFAAPSPAAGTSPSFVQDNPTWEGFPLVVLVIDQSDDGAWSQVRLPRRPNGSTGWVRTSDLSLWEVPNRIEVSLSTHLLTVYRGTGDEVLYSTDVATGRPNTPTPLGDFYIDIVNPLGHHAVYGWGQLSVAGFSEVHYSFGGGIGQMSLHGWNNNSVMGQSVSNGCIRMRNDDIARVAELAPLGTPVSVVA